MRSTALAIGAVAIVFAIAAAWYLRLGREATNNPENAIERVREPAAAVVKAATPARAVADSNAPEAPAEAATREAEPVVAASERADAPAAAPLPGATLVTPMAQLIEAKERLPPEIVQNEREFEAEPVDATWATSAEAGILAKFAQRPGLALTGLRVECRSTMCRLQVASPTTPRAASPPFNILVDSVGLEPRWAISVIDDTGTLQSVAYLWREGLAPKRTP